MSLAAICWAASTILFFLLAAGMDWREQQVSYVGWGLQALGLLLAVASGWVLPVLQRREG